MHVNDFFLEPVKKISFKTWAAKKSKWFSADDVYLSPGIDASAIFREKINGASPLMIARYGSTELTCVLAYIFSNSTKSYVEKTLDYIRGEIPAFWFGHKNRTVATCS